jgi:hypothetical protein
MFKTGHWVAAVAVLLLIAPGVYLVGELTGAPQPARGRGAGAAGGSASDLGARSPEPGSSGYGARRSASAVDVAAGPIASASRAVYQFPAGGDGAEGDASAVDASYSNRDPDFALRGGEFFDPRDLAVLDEIIRANGLTEESSASDYDDGDGVLEARELGDQVWCGSRLRILRMGPTSFATFGYELRELPSSIANMEYLVMLEANNTGLEALPESLGRMQDLERVAAVGNRLTSLPPELATAGRLAEIQVDGNQIQEIPVELQRMSNLKALFVEGNPIQETPRMLVKQNEKLMRGRLQVPMRDLQKFGSDCRLRRR